jgi:hypothetical protein
MAVQKVLRGIAFALSAVVFHSVISRALVPAVTGVCTVLDGVPFFLFA